MNDFLKTQRIVTCVIICVVVIFGLASWVFFFTDKLAWQKIQPPQKPNYLAKIASIETNLLKAWQQSNGLTTTLAFNDSGYNVALLQQMLSQDEKIYPEKKITGYYGDLTKTAVIKFQREYGLPQTGVVDATTKNKLNEVFLQSLCPEQTTIYPELLLKKITKGSPLREDYVPPSLENISHKIKTVGVVCVRQDIIPHLVQMFSDAAKNGVYLAVTSAYRKPDIQKWLRNFWLSMEGTIALDYIAPSGESEHQLGTTVDLTDASIGYAGVDKGFAQSVGGQWLMRNAHKYGFTMSYPKDKKQSVGYEYEPWHWRFVGVDIATSLYNQKLAFNETDFDRYQKPYPLNDFKSGLDLSAKAVLSVFVDVSGREQIIIQKNKEMRLPIASITKLMVALVASDIYKANDKVIISDNALRLKGVSGNYKAGDIFLFKDAINALLIGSHNEIAAALADRIGADAFVYRLNERANALNLRNTRFFNVTGLDPDAGSEEINYSTAADIYKLFRYIFENRTDIFSSLQKSEYQLNDANGLPRATLQNTNKLVANKDVTLRVLGGKTGETPKAKSNLVIVSAAPSGGYLFSVVLGSENHFYDMQKLLDYIKDSFEW